MHLQPQPTSVPHVHHHRWDLCSQSPSLAPAAPTTTGRKADLVVPVTTSPSKHADLCREYILQLSNVLRCAQQRPKATVAIRALRLHQTTNHKSGRTATPGLFCRYGRTSRRTTGTTGTLVASPLPLSCRSFCSFSLFFFCLLCLLVRPRCFFYIPYCFPLHSFRSARFVLLIRVFVCLSIQVPRFILFMYAYPTPPPPIRHGPDLGSLLLLCLSDTQPGACTRLQNGSIDKKKAVGNEHKMTSRLTDLSLSPNAHQWSCPSLVFPSFPPSSSPFFWAHASFSLFHLSYLLGLGYFGQLLELFLFAANPHKRRDDVAIRSSSMRTHPPFFLPFVPSRLCSLGPGFVFFSFFFFLHDHIWACQKRVHRPESTPSSKATRPRDNRIPHSPSNCHLRPSYTPQHKRVFLCAMCSFPRTPFCPCPMRI